MTKNLTGIALAAAAVFAAGSMVSTSALAADMKDAKVHCSGVNSCKGTSECKSAKNECKGHNSCKGQGWVTKDSAKACTDEGGKVVK